MKAENITLKHIRRVNALLCRFAIELLRRAQEHDESKFFPIEADALQKMQDLVDTEGQAAFGTPEYDRRKEMLGPMLQHHYANNSHHPEHYPNGVDGMDLADVVEMFFDWKAASERGEESAMNLTYSTKAYNLSPQLESIFRNTAKNWGFSVK